MGGDDVETGWVLGTPYPMRKTMESITAPGPSQAMVFIEESYLTVDDGYFAVKGPENLSEWQNSPSIRHGKSTALSFADGHAEIKRWLDPRTKPPIQKGKNLELIAPSPNNPDVIWLQERSTGLGR